MAERQKMPRSGNNSQSAFIAKLQKEAALQAKLEKRRLLPAGLDPLTSWIGRYSWQILVVLSGLTSLSLEIMKWVVSN